MKAIETRFYGPGNVRGARIVASDSDGNRASIHYPYETREGEAAHRVAAEALCKKMHWSGALAAGSTRKGYVFVFVDRSELQEQWAAEAEAKERAELQQARVGFRAALAAQEYLDEAPWHTPAAVAAVARRGVDEADVRHLRARYPEEWQAVVLALWELCKDKVAQQAEAATVRASSSEQRCIVCGQLVLRDSAGSYVDATGGDGCWDGVHQIAPGALTEHQAEEVAQREAGAHD